MYIDPAGMYTRPAGHVHRRRDRLAAQVSASGAEAGGVGTFTVALTGSPAAGTTVTGLIESSTGSKAYGVAVVPVSIGRPIASAGRQPDELMREVEAWIEAEMRRLDPEAYGAEATTA
jgi:hypothetical protein